MKGHFDKQLTAGWIDNRLRPTHYGVLTLKQARYTDAGQYRTWTRGSRDIFSAQYGKFIRQFSREVFGKTHWRRHKQMIPNAATLEGDGLGDLTDCWHTPGSKARPGTTSGHKRAHINVMIRRPEHCSELKFDLTFRRCWNDMDWSLPDIYLEERTGNCVGYSLKEGTETLLTEHMRF